MPNAFVEMDFDTWFDTYKPITNHIDTNASFDGHMFETYGEEVEFVKAQEENRIWMYGQGDGGGTFVWNGWGFVNRLGYFITEVPCPADTDMQMRVSEDDIECENCEWLIGEDETLDTHECKECTRCGDFLDPNGYFCENYDTVCRDCCQCGCNP
jgi:hypothetical protein